MHKQRVVKVHKADREVLEKLAKIADKKCFKCKGSGVAKRKHQGLAVVLCECSKKSLDEAERRYQAMQSALEKTIAIEKAKPRYKLTVAWRKVKTFITRWTPLRWFVR